jgi:hypothetical protein
MASAVEVAPNDQRLQYQGRWDITQNAATTVNSGSRIILRFYGTSVAGKFDLTGLTYAPQLYAYVDGVKSTPIILKSPQVNLTPAGLSLGTHTLMLAVKDIDEEGNRWVPPFASALMFKGFTLPAGGQLLPPPPQPKIRMLFLGDSITQGNYDLCGNYSTDSDCADATADYAWLTAQAFGASLEQVGFGAQGLTKPGNGNVPEAGAAFPFNFAGSRISNMPEPNVIVINQGSNDLETDPVSLSQAYLDYLREIRAFYPHSYIVALEPFGAAGVATTASASERLAVEEFTNPVPGVNYTAVPDTRTEFLSTRGWLGPTDFSDPLIAHPLAEGHAKVAARLVPAITQFTGLTPVSLGGGS